MEEITQISIELINYITLLRRRNKCSEFWFFVNYNKSTCNYSLKHILSECMRNGQQHQQCKLSYDLSDDTPKVLKSLKANMAS